MIHEKTSSIKIRIIRFLYHLPQKLQLKKPKGRISYSTCDQMMYLSFTPRDFFAKIWGYFYRIIT
jgi:hypothetical protein